VVIPARHFWDLDFLRKNLPEAVLFDSRGGASDKHYWWAGDSDQVGKYWYGYRSVWLPDSLLAKDQTGRLGDALFSATRHWRVSLHFNKGLAGAPPEEISAARDTSTNPAVLNAFALAHYCRRWSTRLPGHP
jgi:hypothetical protein